MAAESARQFEALEAQAAKLMSVFIKAGHEAVAPALIQPADIFLECVGEEVRGRTYIFNDPDGEELCLRPDLTVPTCRLHLARDPQARSLGRYCYNGPAFRYQPAGVAPPQPREFRQAGIERIGDDAREAAEAETVGLVLAAIAAAGLDQTSLRLGDLGLFHALLEAIDMPSRWRRRLAHLFWRHDRFRAELRRLATDPARAHGTTPNALLAEIAAAPADAEALVERHFDANRIELVGVRTLAEVAAGLAEAAADLEARPLDHAPARLIEDYVSITAPARDATARLQKLLGPRRDGVKTALDSFDHRLAMLANAGVDLGGATFSAEFGRNLEYYTGFVFEVSAAGATPPGMTKARTVAGGGRYDGLMRAVGAPRDVPAVGAAIHTERLLAVVQGARA